MRTLLALTSLLPLACTESPETPRSDVHYVTHPSTGECVASDGTANSAGWSDCDPACEADGTCDDVCIQIWCGDANTPSSDPATGGGIPCTNGFVVDPNGCPTCDCYEPPPPCGDPGPTDPPDCTTNSDGTTTCCDPDIGHSLLARWDA